MRAVTFDFWSGLFASQQTERHEIGVLDKIAFSRVFELRVFNYPFNRNVLSEFTGVPSPKLARDGVVHSKLSDEFNVVVFLAFIADQVTIGVLSLHGSVYSIEQSFKRLKLIIARVGDVKN